MYYFFIVVTVLLSNKYVSCKCNTGNETKINISQGVLKGAKRVTQNGFEYFEFLKVPYAKPPIGNLRFKSPQPAEPWSGERDATFINDTNVCYQIELSPRGSEDCLYLNVYTPKLPTTSHFKSLPVMVYIHGGGFITGSGTNKLESGQDFLVEKDVVVVAINYRLNVFGFISLDIPEVAGNMGLKDQVMALKWIQHNIHSFGGDKDKVTLFGISAGSCAIEYHMMSPLSRGLFHRAILQSGTTLTAWITNENTKDIPFEIAKKFGYQGTNSDNRAIYNLLMQQSTETLGQAAFDVIGSNPKNILFYSFFPVIEKDFCNGEAFITEHPYDLLKEGRFSKVDVIRGFAEYEGLIWTSSSPQSLTDLQENRNFTIYCEIFPLNYTNTQYCNEKLKELYYDVDKNDSDPQQFAINFVSDFDIIHGVWFGSKLMAEHGVRVHTYMFAYDGNLNYVKIFLDIKKKGACHADEIGYLMSVTFPVEVHINATDILTRRRLAQMWSDFAKTGNPTPVTNDVVNVHWPAFNNNQQQYLRIDSELSVQSKYKPRRMEFFEKSYDEKDD